VVSALGSERRPQPGPTLRRRIAVLVSAAIPISYLDRRTLPVAVKAVERDIPVTNQQFSLLQTAFLITYAVTYAAGGWPLDALGTRLGLMIIMVSWSVAGMSHGLAAKPNARRRCTPAPFQGWALSVS
jgi:ACS family hexuronate transporter-like MFS transporter